MPMLNNGPLSFGRLSLDSKQNTWKASVALQIAYLPFVKIGFTLTTISRETVLS